MLKFFILLTLTIITFIHIVPAYCAPAARSLTLQVSATIPEHVMAIGALGVAPLPNMAFQLIQTETVIRNNKPINLTSIVVP